MPEARVGMPMPPVGQQLCDCAIGRSSLLKRSCEQISINSFFASSFIFQYNFIPLVCKYAGCLQFFGLVFRRAFLDSYIASAFAHLHGGVTSAGTHGLYFRLPLPVG